MNTYKSFMVGLGVAALVLITSVLLTFTVAEVLNESDFINMRPLVKGEVLTEAEVQQRAMHTELANKRLTQRLKNTSVGAQFLDRTSTFFLWIGLPVLAFLLARIWWLRRFRELVPTACPLSVLALLAVATKLYLSGFA